MHDDLLKGLTNRLAMLRAELYEVEQRRDELREKALHTEGSVLILKQLQKADQDKGAEDAEDLQNIS